MGKEVSLVLASGGARGLIYMGCIDVLLERGYEITSVAGCSMGALVGGLFASGHYDAIKRWFLKLDRIQMAHMIDFSLGTNHFIKGKGVINELKKVVPDCKIEDLPIPFTAVATDIMKAEEYVFTKGSLYDAIRASISMPLFFKPVTLGDRVLVDGGMSNPLPLSHAKRDNGEIVVALNVSAPYSKTKGENIGGNYISLIDRSLSILIQQSTLNAIDRYKPDIVVNIAMDAFGSFDYDKADILIEYGRKQMIEALANQPSTFTSVVNKIERIVKG